MALPVKTRYGDTEIVTDYNPETLAEFEKSSNKESPGWKEIPLDSTTCYRMADGSYQSIEYMKERAIIRSSKRFKESALAHELLDSLGVGLQIGGSAHNDFGLRTINCDKWGEMDTPYKLQEIELCGEALPVDVVCPGDELPFPDKSFPFIISSHVLEHFFDPIKTLKEWARVATDYIYIIFPQPDALPSDVDKPLTTAREIIDRHNSLIPDPGTDEHHTRMHCDYFAEMCEHYGFHVSHRQQFDDKVGNGFTIVIDLKHG